MVHLDGGKSLPEYARVYGSITSCCHRLSHTAILKDSNCNRDLEIFQKSFNQKTINEELCATCFPSARDRVGRKL